MHKHTRTVVWLTINLKKAVNKTLIQSVAGANSLLLQLRSLSVLCMPLVSSWIVGNVTDIYRSILQSLHTNSGIETFNLATTNSIPRHSLTTWTFYIVIRSYRQEHLTEHTRVRTLMVATIYLQLIQNRYMFRSFTVLQCSHQHCVKPVASDVEVVGYL